LDLRAEFALDPAVTFLNHGSYGATPREVLAEQRRLQDLLEAQPVAFCNSANQARLHGAVRRALAPELGAAPEDIVHFVNATQALNAVAGSLDLAAGDEILTTDHEYAALSKTWAEVCRRTGAVVKAVTVPLPFVS
jgi:isopenicillin-N epimerase